MNTAACMPCRAIATLSAKSVNKIIHQKKTKKLECSSSAVKLLFVENWAEKLSLRHHDAVNHNCGQQRSNIEKLCHWRNAEMR